VKPKGEKETKSSRNSVGVSQIEIVNAVEPTIVKLVDHLVSRVIEREQAKMSVGGIDKSSNDNLQFKKHKNFQEGCDTEIGDKDQGLCF
jgi:hypothetical protein